jgi:SAM-dependent methyltransferase
MPRDVPMDSNDLRRAAGGYRLSQAIRAFAELGLADALAQGPRTADELAAECGCHLPYLRRLLRALASENVLASAGTGVFALTEASRDLMSGAGLRAMVLGWSVFHPTYAAFAHLGHAVRTGRPPFEIAHGTDFHKYLAAHTEDGALYDEAMESTIEAFEDTVSHYDFSRFHTVVDVGGGGGGFLVALLRAHRQAHGICFDLPGVVANAERRGVPADVADRLEMRAGDFFADPLPTGDAFTLLTVLRLFEDEVAIRLLRAIARVLPPHGVVVVEDFWLPEGVPPSPLGLSDLQALCAYGGRDRTRAEYELLLDAARLRMGGVVDLEGPFAIFEATRA